MTINRKMWAWFEQGRASQALRGQGDFFVANNTYRDRHDDGLVLSQLSDWVAASGSATHASSALSEALEAHLEAGRAERVVGLVWAYMVASQYQEMSFALDLGRVREILAAAELVEDAPSALAGFGSNGVTVAFLQEQLASSDGYHFDVPRWEPPARPSP